MTKESNFLNIIGIWEELIHKEIKYMFDRNKS